MSRKSKSIIVVIKRVGEAPEEALIDNKLKTFQDLVGGYIEAPTFKNDIDMVCNEEGLLEGLPVNFVWREQTIVGDVVFTASNGKGQWRSLTNAEIAIIRLSFAERNDPK